MSLLTTFAQFDEPSQEDDLYSWIDKVADLTDADISTAGGITFWRKRFDEGLTPQEAVDAVFPSGSNPILAALSRFDQLDKQADYKVQPFPSQEIKPTKPSKELTSYMDDVYPRMDSKSIKDIEKLYNVRHECYEYKNNIMEDAHPNMLVLLPAYDKMNGLVESDLERQRINLNILRKPVSGLEYRQKYAELIKALVKTANDMDFQSHESLSTLADDTIKRLQKEAFELGDIGKWFEGAGDIAGGAGSGATIGSIAGGLIGAFTGAAAGGAGAIPGAWAGAKLGGIAGGALGGVLSAIFKTAPIARSVQQNAHVAKDKIDALLKDHPDDIFLSQLDTALLHIQDTALTYSKLASQMQAAHNVDEGEVMKVGQSYIQEIQKLDNMIDVFLANAKEGKYVPDEADWVSKIKSPLRGIIGDTLHDAMESVETLESVSHTAMDSILHAKAQASKLVETTEQPGEASQDELAELMKTLSPGK